MRSHKLRPVMSLSDRDALWVMLAPGFEKKSLGSRVCWNKKGDISGSAVSILIICV